MRARIPLQRLSRKGRRQYLGHVQRVDVAQPGPPRAQGEKEKERRRRQMERDKRGSS